MHTLWGNMQNSIQKGTSPFEKIAHEPVRVFVRHIPLGSAIEHESVHPSKCTNATPDTEQATNPVLGHAVSIGI